LRPRRPLTRRSRRLAGALSLAVAALLVCSSSAFAGLVTPEHGGSPNADKISDLYMVVLYVAIVVFIGVEGTLLYSVIRFRARKGRVPAQIRGNTRLEIGWTIGAALILVVLTVVTFALLPDDKPGLSDWSDQPGERDRQEQPDSAGPVHSEGSAHRLRAGLSLDGSAPAGAIYHP